MSEYEKNLLVLFHVFCHTIKNIGKYISFNLRLNIIVGEMTTANHLNE